ncbi:hypothetical protein ACG04Q_00855 [Roseateles sp. DXS20W]|uniref:Uncharacterized protein n=1 Tax=Pelomonas lactea TaxID=3299030 RepID=A0ABW7GE23_9BURK
MIGWLKPSWSNYTTMRALELAQQKNEIKVGPRCGDQLPMIIGLFLPIDALADAVNLHHIRSKLLIPSIRGLVTGRGMFFL